jgi:protein gp37
MHTDTHSTRMSLVRSFTAVVAGQCTLHDMTQFSSRHNCYNRHDCMQNRLATHAAAGSAASEEAHQQLNAHRTHGATTAVTAAAAAAATALVRVPAHQQVDERFESSMADLLHRKVHNVFIVCIQ